MRGVLLCMYTIEDAQLIYIQCTQRMAGIQQSHFTLLDFATLIKSVVRFSLFRFRPLGYRKVLRSFRSRCVILCYRNRISGGTGWKMNKYEFLESRRGKQFESPAASEF